MSASPRTTAIALAPADPMPTSSACIALATATASAAGRVRLTSMRKGLFAGGRAAGVCDVSVRSSPGSATAPTVATPSTASATCTAQSVRPSPYSRVPSTGSMIHTRDCASRVPSHCISSDSSPSSGRASRIAWTRNWLAVWSPALPSALAGKMPLSRTVSSRRPVVSARCAASSQSVRALI